MDDEPVFSGVTLAQHAGVTAAIADGIALDAVLQQEGIEGEAWRAANPKWRAALADEPALHSRYIQKRREAEECLARRVRPVDEDAASWLGLLNAVNAASDSETVLKPLGLRSTDLARLGRQWRRKAEADPEVAKELVDLAPRAQAPRSVDAEPPKLKPFPWTRKQSATSVGQANPGEGNVLRTRVGGVLPVEQDVDLYAALCAVLQLFPQEITRILRLCGLTERDLPALHEAWLGRLRGSPDLHAQFKVRSADHRTVFRRILAGARPSLAGQPE